MLERLLLRLRYSIESSILRCSESVLEVWAYEAFRLFRDRMVGTDSINRFDNIVLSIVRADWSTNLIEGLRGKNAIHAKINNGMQILYHMIVKHDYF